MKKLLVALVMAVAVPVGMTTVTSFTFVPEAQAFSFKNAVKKVGRAVKKGGKAVGRGTKRAGKAVGRGAKKAGKYVGRGAKKTGKAVWKGAKCIAKGGCATIGPAPGNPQI